MSPEVHTATIINFPVAQHPADTLALAAAEDLASFEVTERIYFPPILSLVKPEIQELADVIPLNPYPEVAFRQPCAANAEMFDDLAETMSNARQVARGILEDNKQKLHDGHFESVPLDVDALGTASKAVAIGRKYGKDSPEYASAEQAVLMDKDRRLDEAESNNIWRYFEAITYKHDAAVTTVDGLPYDKVVVNGLSPLGHSEDVERRIHDYAKLQLTKTLVNNPNSAKIAVINQMSCPDYAIEGYKIDPKGAHGGYVPAVRKRMIGFETFNPEKSESYYEQVALRGDKITEEVVNKGYQVIGAIEPGQELGKTEMYGTQVIVQLEEMPEVFDFIAILDDIASEDTGQNIFMGEVVAADHPKDYNQVREEARLERAKRRDRAEKLKDYAINLEEQGTDHALATVMEDKFVKDLLLDAAQEEPEIALRAFDRETAVGFQQAQALQAQGRYAEAEEAISATRLNAPAAGGCGAGSCGLEALDSMNTNDQKAKAMLNVESDEDVVKDTVRKCKKGHPIYYAYTKSSVKKACVQCGDVEKDGKLIESGEATSQKAA